MPIKRAIAKYSQSLDTVAHVGDAIPSQVIVDVNRKSGTAQEHVATPGKCENLEKEYVARMSDFLIL